MKHHKHHDSFPMRFMKSTITMTFTAMSVAKSYYLVNQDGRQFEHLRNYFLDIIKFFTIADDLLLKLEL